MSEVIARLAGDPVAFVQEVLINPESGEPFELYPEQVRFLREAFTLTPGGRLPYSEVLFNAPKKSGKTTIAEMGGLFVILALAGRYGEALCVANDYEQAQGRVFQGMVRIIEASPLLKSIARLRSNVIEFPSTGATITAIASDYASAAGSNANIAIFDELWGFTLERSVRLWDECVPPPTRKVATRLTVSYAGFSGESTLLENLVKRGRQGTEIATDLYSQPGMLAYITHRCPAPWQTPEWREQMRAQLRPNQFLRMIENREVTSEETFVPMEWYDECVDPELHPQLQDRQLPIYIGIDASTKRDSTAIVATSFDRERNKVRLVWHKIFQPSPEDPLDFESTVEATVLDLKQRFTIKQVRYDPFQMAASSQRLRAKGIRMVEFPQTVPNLTSSSTNCYELLKGRNLMLYQDDDIRLAISRAVALETTRGWRIAKEKASHKIDVIVALAMSALGAVESQRTLDFGGIRFEALTAPSSNRPESAGTAWFPG